MRVRRIAAALALLLLACGSEEGRLERGDTVDREVAVPESNKDMKESEAKRRDQEEHEEEDAVRYP